MATDMHTFLSRRALPWLKNRGFHWAATEVSLGWKSENGLLDDRGRAKYLIEDADAAGCCIHGAQPEAKVCVIEVKVSRGDFLSDYKKLHRSEPNPLVTERFYLTPAGLVKPEEVPAPWGLLEYDAKHDKIINVKRAKILHPDKYKCRNSYKAKPVMIAPEGFKRFLDERGYADYCHVYRSISQRIINDFQFRYHGFVEVGREYKLGETRG